MTSPECPFCRKLAALHELPPEDVVWQFPPSVALLGTVAQRRSVSCASFLKSRSIVTDLHGRDLDPTRCAPRSHTIGSYWRSTASWRYYSLACGSGRGRLRIPDSGNSRRDVRSLLMEEGGFWSIFGNDPI
jgi:hypothetical protein